MACNQATAFAKSIVLLPFLGAQLGLWQEAAQASHRMHLSQLASEKPAQLQKPQFSTSICAAQLPRAIEVIINRPQFSRSHWGVLVQTLSNRPQTLYAHQPNSYFIPASTAKLLTTAAALHQLGPQFRYRTSVYQVGANPRLVLRIVGRGDPSLSDNQLQGLAQQLSRQGIRQVNQLIADDSHFRGSAIDSSWEWQDIQAGYGAPVNSLILNQNSVELKLFPQILGQPLRVVWTDSTEANRWRVKNSSVTVGPQAPEFVDVGRDFTSPTVYVTGQLRVGAEPEPVSVAIFDPAQYFLRHFRQALNANQIRVAQSAIASSPRIQTEREVAAIESPLSKLLLETNQESNNLYAESLLKTLGSTQTKPTGSSAEIGLEVVKTTLTRLGVNPQTYILADGSGLSRHNLISPVALVQTLNTMARTPQAAMYRASLPVAGISGTLQDRFRGTPAQGILHAKTGSMSGVAALSGYLSSPNFSPLVFSILVNQSEQSSTALRQAIDEMVLLLARLRSC